MHSPRRAADEDTALTARRATAEAAEAAKIITDNLEAFSQAATATDAGLAMARIYDAIPKDDLSLDAVNPETGFLGQAERLDVFRELASRRDESGLWTQDNVESFKALRAALDLLHVTDLKGYLSFAGLLGGGLYIAALWVQQTLPGSSRRWHLFLAACFSAPVLFAYFWRRRRVHTFASVLPLAVLLASLTDARLASTVASICLDALPIRIDRTAPKSLCDPFRSH